MKNDLFEKIDEIIWWHFRRSVAAFGLLIFAALFIGLTAALDGLCGNEIFNPNFCWIAIYLWLFKKLLSP